MHSVTPIHISHSHNKYSSLILKEGPFQFIIIIFKENHVKYCIQNIPRGKMFI